MLKGGNRDARTGKSVWIFKGETGIQAPLNQTKFEKRAQEYTDRCIGLIFQRGNRDPRTDILVLIFKETNRDPRGIRVVGKFKVRKSEMKLERLKLESSGGSWKVRAEVRKDNWSWKVTGEVGKFWFNFRTSLGAVKIFNGQNHRGTNYISIVLNLLYHMHQKFRRSTTN